MSAEPELRIIGFWTATALVVGNMIGSGLFLLPSSLATFGAASTMGWLLSGVGALFLARVFAELVARHPKAGGPYAFARLGFGERTGFVVAWCYWISIWCGIPAVAIALTGYLGALFPDLTSTPLRAAFTTIALLWTCTFFNLMGLRTSGGVVNLTTAIKLGALVVFIFAAVFFIVPAHFEPFNPSGQPLLNVANTTAALIMWAFLGLESGTVPADRVKDPQRTLPRATLVGSTIVIVVTISACLAVMGILPPEVAKASSAPFADAVSSMFGSGAGRATALIAAVACLGTLNGWVLLSGQLPLAVARDGLFPAVFARTNAHGTPQAAFIIGSVLSSVLVIAKYTSSMVGLFTFSILLSTAACLVPYVICSAALLRVAQSMTLRIVSAIALLYAMYTLYGTGEQAWLWGVVLLLLGIPVYVLQVYGGRRHPA
ncbi:MAG: amino acid permease [Tahibacter sp.]